MFALLFVRWGSGAWCMVRNAQLYFSLAALDALGGLDSVDKKAIREWVYKMQVVPTVKDSGEGV